MPVEQQDPTPLRDLIEFLGLNRQKPKSGIECFKQVGQFPSHVRGAIERIMNLSN